MSPLTHAVFVVLVVLLSAGITARLFLLLTVDEITWPIRKQVDRSWSWLQSGFYCVYCLGFWIALAFVWTGLAAFDVFSWWALVAGAGTANLLAAERVLKLS